MPFSHLKLSAPCTLTKLVPSTLASPRSAHVLDFCQVQPSTAHLNCRVSLVMPRSAHVLDFCQVQPSTAHLNCRVSLVKNVPTLKPVCSKGPPTCKGLRLNMEEASHVSGCREQGFGMNHSGVETEIEDTALDSCSNSEESFVIDDQHDAKRKMIGLATKKKVPWNKGKKHSAETRERIRTRTREAMRDPKVRMKISELPRPPHSKRARAKISASQTRSWDKRLKWKRSRENFFILWCNSIANAAKRGGVDQDKLKWEKTQIKGRASC